MSNSLGCNDKACIHIDKIYDSCKDKECLENIRVYNKFPARPWGIHGFATV